MKSKKIADSHDVFLFDLDGVVYEGGKAIEHALGSMGYSALTGVRLGKEIELTVNTGDRAEAERLVDEAARRLLANTVMEDYSFTLTEA